MILEGLVTTISPEGELNIAPMGPIVDPEMKRLTLRPFRTSHTCRNLMHLGEGVFHITDDVFTLALAAIGPVEPMPSVSRGTSVLGYVLDDACRFFEFRILSIDDSSDRVRMEAEVTHSGSHRDFLGFNRAKHAVLEAAILATRTAILPMDEIEREFVKHEIVVNKTGGAREIAAFAILKDFVEREKTRATTPNREGSP